MPSEEVWTDDRRRAWEAAQDGLMQALQAVLATWHDARPHTPMPQLQQRAGTVRSIVRQQEQAHTITVLAAGSEHPDPEVMDAIPTSLFDSHAATLLVPTTPALQLGRRIALAWETSEAADHAVLSALPLLLKAEQVWVLVAKEPHRHAGQPEGLIQTLAQNGRPARMHQFDLAGRAIGLALLQETHAVDADLLVMGAFSHNRILEAVFGGATQEVLRSLDIPVLMHT
jgi:nucleotide-binding universal stress UspA family protein